MPHPFFSAVVVPCGNAARQGCASALPQPGHSARKRDDALVVVAEQLVFGVVRLAFSAMVLVSIKDLEPPALPPDYYRLAVDCAYVC